MFHVNTAFGMCVAYTTVHVLRKRTIEQKDKKLLFGMINKVEQLADVSGLGSDSKKLSTCVKSTGDNAVMRFLQQSITTSFYFPKYLQVLSPPVLFPNRTDILPGAGEGKVFSSALAQKL